LEIHRLLGKDKAKSTIRVAKYPRALATKPLTLLPASLRARRMQLATRLERLIEAYDLLVGGFVRNSLLFVDVWTWYRSVDCKLRRLETV
jgi:hypothetical protein